MLFRQWLETAIGTTDRPLYHAHPNVDELKKTGFTKDNLDHAGSGMASVALPGGGRTEYGAGGGIHLSRSLKFCTRFASGHFGQLDTAGVVEVYFHTRRPFFVPSAHTGSGKTRYKTFVNPEDKYLLPLTGVGKTDVDKIALTIEKLTTTKQVFELNGNLGSYALKGPMSIQCKQLAHMFLFGGKGYTLNGWPLAYRKANEVFNEDPFTILGPFRWNEWAEKGYLDSVWWGPGNGPFHGEDEVTVFDPKRIRVGSVIYRTKSDPTIYRRPKD